MNSDHLVVCAALLSGLVFATPGCRREEASAGTPRPAAAETAPDIESAPDMKTAEPPAPEPAAPAGQAVGARPGEPNSKDLVALGSGGSAQVVAVDARTLADTPTYKLTLAAPATVSKGAQGTMTLEILPKEGWKLNKEFPTKLTVAEPAGVKVAKKEQTVADAVAFADKSGKWSVEFQAESVGAKAFTGQIKFAVCTETSCDPKKEQLAWNVAVSD